MRSEIMNVDCTEREWVLGQLEGLKPQLAELGLEVVIAAQNSEEWVEFYSTRGDSGEEQAPADLPILSGMSISTLDEVYLGKGRYRERLSYNAVANAIRLIESPMRMVDSLRRRAAILGIRTYVDVGDRTFLLSRPSGQKTEYKLEELSQVDSILNSLENLQMQRLELRKKVLGG